MHVTVPKFNLQISSPLVAIIRIRIKARLLLLHLALLRLMVVSPMLGAVWGPSFDSFLKSARLLGDANSGSKGTIGTDRYNGLINAP